MAKRIDLKGKVFGRLTVVEKAAPINRRSAWVCRCDCGATVIVKTEKLTSGHTRSCGCLRREAARIRVATIGGLYSEKLHGVWNTMKQRCSNLKARDFKYYGARGVCVCDEWQDYLSFRQWALANGYKEGLTIDRINTFGNYEPGNCRWITIQEQQKNRRPRRIEL